MRPKRVSRLLPASSESGAKLSKRNRSMRRCDICPALGLARHVAVELLVDDVQLVAGERAGVLVGCAQRAVVEQLLAPDVRADERELAPVRRRCRRRASSAAGAACSCPTPRRPWCSSPSAPPAAATARYVLGGGGLAQPRLDQAADLVACQIVAGDVGRERRDQSRGRPRRGRGGRAAPTRPAPAHGSAAATGASARGMPCASQAEITWACNAGSGGPAMAPRVAHGGGREQTERAAPSRRRRSGLRSTRRSRESARTIRRRSTAASRVRIAS